ncbi:hypothetical protein SAMN04488128_103180 [Chitinophaga eiseniae]|uniref:Uncharacterized protein n=1 Tax=Chitinophaga eiseniae TaxID=634771 RepID=A0A1T4SNX5_9BACT|nr:hypothetical protein SAMN04488128_103180 [Chitinophaga eiseniae]
MAWYNIVTLVLCAIAIGGAVCSVVLARSARKAAKASREKIAQSISEMNEIQRQIEECESIRKQYNYKWKLPR